MPRTNLWNQSVPRVELDQRSRAARLRFERIDRLFKVRPTMMHLRLRRLLYLFTVGRYGALPREGGVKELPSDRWPSRLPMLLGILVGKCWSLQLARRFQLLASNFDRYPPPAERERATRSPSRRERQVGIRVLGRLTG